MVKEEKHLEIHSGLREDMGMIKRMCTAQWTTRKKLKL